MTRGESLIRVRDLAKTYYLGDHAVPALRGISLEVDRGEFVAVMGPSGSGKSTFMNLLGCLDSPTDGQYFLEGRDVARLSRDALAAVRSRQIGFVFQTFNLLPRMTAMDNVELPLLYRGAPAAERRRRAAACLHQVGLRGREDHRPNQLSGGQQQRVAIARALVNAPALILADEPTGNLDSRTSVEILAILQGLNQQGITILLVTHEEDIARYTRRILRFRDGRLRSDQRVETPSQAETVLAALLAEAVA